MTGLREVNMEQGMPRAADAIRRMDFEIHHSREMHVAVVKLIHGYGSSGKGGTLRTVLRSRLSQLQQKGLIKYIIEGERFSIFDDDTRRAFLICGDLRKDRDLERHNNGVTFVVLTEQNRT